MEQPRSRLDEKVAIVTGGGRGIGRAIALSFAREGAKVVVCARTASEIDGMAGEIRKMGGSAQAVRADVSQEQDVADLVSQTLEHFHGVDILVNNAAVNLPDRRIVDLTLDEWNNVLAVNLTGAFLCAKAVLPQMMSQRSGKIINISSIGGRRGAAARGACRASKAGLINLTETLAAEAREHGIAVNCICPGAVDTDMMRLIGCGAPRQTMTLPEEIAAVALFLASADSSAITGATIDAFGDSNPLFR